MVYKYKTANSDRYKLLKDFAKNNRDNPTMAESLLWQTLKGNSLGVKFQRQHIIYDFIVDFICIEKNLILEIDGGYHNLPQQQIDDSEREHILNSFGYKVLRFKNEEVLHNTDYVIQTIKQSLN